MIQNPLNTIGNEEDNVRREFNISPIVHIEKIGELWYVVTNGQKIDVREWKKQKESN